MRGSALTLEYVWVGGRSCGDLPAHAWHAACSLISHVLIRGGARGFLEPLLCYPGGPRVGSRTTHLFPSPPSSWAQPWDPGEGVASLVYLCVAAFRGVGGGCYGVVWRLGSFAVFCRCVAFLLYLFLPGILV